MTRLRLENVIRNVDGNPDMSELELPSLDEQQAYYDRRWVKESLRPNRLELMRLAEVLRALFATRLQFDREDVRICDLGCGRGWVAAQLAAFAPVTGVDLSKDGVAAAQKRWPHIQFIHADITRFRSEEPFDVVVSSEVLEHVPDKPAFFETAARILRPGGHLILTTPNKKLLGLYLKSGSELQPVEAWLSVRELRKLAQRDFAIVLHHTFLFDLFYGGIFRVISAPKLIAACKALRLDGLRRWLFRLLDLGLHQILVARRIG